ncbi:hypothetical protein [Burkholderia vietnamiensis]|uniref:hypothetical protein n=1 Tax=Burkholderia vietnamiensis TaxID=60552 RepID=UPI001CF43EC4|nr:hypothetical protein [Burkholderia vietnamiensis]MCA8073156.1 hypothetical protein [Burkholderia vietnamiensis]
MTTDNTPRAAALTAAQHEPPAADERPTDDALWDQTLHERDNYQEWADKLANAIAAHLNVDIGEHSNVNNPWREALEAIENAAPASAPVGLTDELRAVMQDAARSLSVRADELKESNTSIDGKWCDADEKAAYDAEVRLVERLRALLATQQPEPSAELTNAEVRALLQLEEAIRHDRAMFEGTSDEDNPMGSLVTTALKALDAARTGASS